MESSKKEINTETIYGLELDGMIPPEENITVQLMVILTSSVNKEQDLWLDMRKLNLDIKYKQGSLGGISEMKKCMLQRQYMTSSR